MGRAPCCEKNGLKRGPWTQEEDKKLIDYIQEHGYGNWRTLPKNAGLQRCGKSCRLRWTNYLRPDIKRGKFSYEEEEIIVQLHGILGNKWSAIAARLPGRTDNEIKNYWNTHIRKKLLRMGIDPVTHTPRLDLLDLSAILNSSLYNNPLYQMNYSSRLLGMHPLINNPELMRLASNILSSQTQNQDFLIHNQIINDNPQARDQITPPLIQTSSLHTMPCFPLSDHHHQPQQLQYDDVHQFPQALTGFGSLENDWLGSALPALTNSGYCGSGQLPADPAPSSETSTFVSNNSNNFSFGPVLSSSSSSPITPLNSNSNYNVSSSSVEDEREISYCSDMLKFEIPDFSDVNVFM